MLNTNALSFSSHPLEDSDYMSEQMLNYFKNRPQKMHAQILKKEEEISSSLLDEPIRVSDPIERKY